MLSFRPFYILDIRLEILTAEAKRVSGVDNLHDKMRSFKHSPKLSPDLDVPFERGEQKIITLLQSIRDLSQSPTRCEASGITYSARPLLHSRKASFSCLSSCAVVMVLVHGGLRGTRSRSLFSACRCRVFCSSSSESRYGLCCAAAGALMIFTFLRSGYGMKKRCGKVCGGIYVPAVN